MLELFVAPQAPVPEPVLTLSYPGMDDCTITYTGLHHLLNCGGWGDPRSSYGTQDHALKLWLEEVRRRMGDEGSLRIKRRSLPGSCEPETVSCVVDSGQFVLGKLTVSTLFGST